MIISKTPFRISFAGGGSDMPGFYRQRPGAVVSTAIDKYMYVTVNKRFDETIRVSYTRTEIADSIDQIDHDLVREGLRLVGVPAGVEITTIADVPAGTGLGSSSSLTVGLLNALYGFRHRLASADQLAQDAARIEIDIVRRPIGKQDHYAAAHGGLNYIEFFPDETVRVTPIILPPASKQRLESSFLMFYLGTRGDNDELLREQGSLMNNAEKQRLLEAMVGIAGELKDALAQHDVRGVGKLLHENWELKKQIASHISSPAVDRHYASAREAGAEGGKVLGAGGAGFLLLSCPPESQEAVRRAMEGQGLREFPFRFEPHGSQIVHVGGTS